MNKAYSYGRYFEDFDKGNIFEHALTKTVTESDNNLFSLITMNHHPIHLDSDYASHKIHGKILVVGTYVLSVIVGISVADISGRAIANLGYDNVKHLSPVFIGDTLSATSEIIDCQLTSAGVKGIIKVKTIAMNQRHECVLSFERSVLVPLRNE